MTCSKQCITVNSALADPFTDKSQVKIGNTKLQKGDGPFLSKNTNDEETFNFFYELALDKYRQSTFTLKNDSGYRSIYYF